MPAETQIKSKKCFLSHLTAFEERYPSKLWLALSLLWGVALYPAFINGIAILWSIILWALLILYMRKCLVEGVPEVLLNSKNQKESHRKGRYFFWYVCANAVCIFITVFVIGWLMFGVIYILQAPEVLGLLSSGNGVNFAEYISLKMESFKLRNSFDYQILSLVFHENIGVGDTYFTEIKTTSMQYMALWLFSLTFFKIVSFVCIGRFWWQQVDTYRLYYNDMPREYYHYHILLKQFVYVVFLSMITLYYINALFLFDVWESVASEFLKHLARHLVLQTLGSVVLLVNIAGYIAHYNIRKKAVYSN